MARAYRHFISGYAWHLTHRCHKREFLLKFAKDKQRWMYWLFEAKKRFGLCVLNFTVTSNHVHLLIYDTGNGNESIGRKVVENEDSFVLREQQASYQRNLNRAIRVQPEDNTIYWQNGPENHPDSNMSLEGSF